MSDFPSAIARVRAGECPLCGSELHRAEVSTFASEITAFELVWCSACEPPVGWKIVGARDPLPEHGQAFGLGPMLVPSRKLTDDEARSLYSKPVES